MASLSFNLLSNHTLKCVCIRALLSTRQYSEKRACHIVKAAGCMLKSLEESGEFQTTFQKSGLFSVTVQSNHFIHKSLQWNAMSSPDAMVLLVPL